MNEFESEMLTCSTPAKIIALLDPEVAVPVRIRKYCCRCKSTDVLHIAVIQWFSNRKMLRL